MAAWPNMTLNYQQTPETMVHVKIHVCIVVRLCTWLTITVQRMSQTLLYLSEISYFILTHIHCSCKYQILFQSTAENQLQQMNVQKSKKGTCLSVWFESGGVQESWAPQTSRHTFFLGGGGFGLFIEIADNIKNTEYYLPRPLHLRFNHHSVKRGIRQYFSCGVCTDCVVPFLVNDFALGLLFDDKLFLRSRRPWVTISAVWEGLIIFAELLLVVSGAISPLGGVFVLLCTASSKVHPSVIISVLYPVAWGQSAGSACEGGSGLVGGAWGR